MVLKGNLFKRIEEMILEKLQLHKNWAENQSIYTEKLGYHRSSEEVKTDENKKNSNQVSQEWESYFKKIKGLCKNYLVNKENNTTCFENVEVNEKGDLKIEKYKSNLKSDNCQKCRMSLKKSHKIVQRFEFEIEKFIKHFGVGNLKNFHNYLIDEN